MLVCVTGMHHSGTSVTAEILNGCGLSWGAPDGIQKRGDQPHNEGGSDNLEVEAINVSIIKQAGGLNWLMLNKVDGRLVCDPIDKQRLIDAGSLYQEAIRHFGKTFKGKMFENPVTSLTIDSWDQFCPEITHYAICFRNPWHVAQSLRRREGIPFHAGIDIWYEHNERILNCDTKKPKLYLNYENYRDNLEDEFRNLFDKIEYLYTDEEFREGMNFYHRGKDHGIEEKSPILQKAHDLYEHIVEKELSKYGHMAEKP